MHPAHHLRGLRRLGVSAALAALLGVVTIALSQCQQVTDTLTGVSLTKAKPVNCIASCAHDYGDSMQAESRIHVDAVKACRGDDICLALEQVRHDQAVERIRVGRKQCMDDCHHQGGGHGG